MAYTKILVIHGRLDTRVNYIRNPEKTTGRRSRGNSFNGVDDRYPDAPTSDADDPTQIAPSTDIDDCSPDAPASDGLSRALDYALNPDKDEQRVYEGAVNCMTGTAFQEMMETKQRWGKTGKRQGYHIIQSFKPGELSPELAIEVGRRFVERYLAVRYQAVYSVHLDRAHIHVHIVFNSVSFVDGRKYHADSREYERNIRRISDELCREYDLSVIERKETTKRKAYAEWQAEQQHRPTVRDPIRADVDAAFAQAFTFKGFVDLLRSMGYAVKHGPNVKYMAVRPPGSERFFRLYKLGESYSEEAIRERVIQQRRGREERGAVPAEKERITRSQAQGQRSPSVHGQRDRRDHAATISTHARMQLGHDAIVRADARSGIRADTSSPRSRTRVAISRPVLRRTTRLRGFQALVWHYLYLLGKVQKRQAPTKRLPFPMRAAVIKYDQYATRFRFLADNRIETDADLRSFVSHSHSLIDTLADQRAQLHQRKRGVMDESPQKAALSQEIAQLSAAIRDLRKDVRLAERIGVDSDELREKYDALRHAMLGSRSRVRTMDRVGPRSMPSPNRTTTNGKEEPTHEPRG